MATALQLRVPIVLFFILFCPTLMSMTVMSAAPVSAFSTPAESPLPHQELQESISLTAGSLLPSQEVQESAFQGFVHVPHAVRIGTYRQLFQPILKPLLILKPILMNHGFHQSFLTIAITISPTQAEGNRLRRPLIPFTDMMYRFFAPVLSAQFTVAATGRPSDIRNLFPADPPRPRFDIFVIVPQLPPAAVETDDSVDNLFDAMSLKKKNRCAGFYKLTMAIPSLSDSPFSTWNHVFSEKRRFDVSNTVVNESIDRVHGLQGFVCSISDRAHSQGFVAAFFQYLLMHRRSGTMEYQVANVLLSSGEDQFGIDSEPRHGFEHRHVLEDDAAFSDLESCKCVSFPSSWICSISPNSADGCWWW